MKVSMQKVLFSFFLGLANICFAWTLSTGTYELSGSSADGTPYHGEVVIKRQGNNYRVEWYTGGRSTQIGVGMLDSWSNIFSIAFADASNPKFWGVASYTLNIFGELEGKWTTHDGYSYGVDRLIWKNYSTY